MTKNVEKLTVAKESLADYIEISRQFLRSVRLDTDYGREDALTGYICQGTARSLLGNMAKQINETQQRAFTWTGPYGGGKSSLALVMCSLVSPNIVLRKKAKELIDLAENSDVDQVFKVGSSDWLILPVVGRRESVVNAIDDALNHAGPEDKNVGRKPGRPRLIKGTDVIERLVAEASSRLDSGVLLVIDELGKFLESAAQTGDDIYFYQELAEAASRCQGKLIVIGILHQSFEQYATRLGRDSRSEWAKVQGRFIDIPLVAGTDEVIELVSRAISYKKTYEHDESKVIVKSVADAIRQKRPGAPQNIEDGLNRCWPLHPITASLLGPISKRRFGQNERSTFGFLASREPIGFTEFLHSHPFGSLEFYGANLYWDYLKANLEPSILASPDGHRWSVGAEAVERAESKGSPLHVSLVKTIALIEMFKNGSGLTAENAVLIHSVKNAKPADVKSALSELERRSIIIFRKHLNAWGIYSGSDFDVEAAVLKAHTEVDTSNLKRVSEVSDLYPVIAKRLYRDTGTMRWFSRSIIFSSEFKSYQKDFQPTKGSSGEFVLVLPAPDATKRSLDNLVLNTLDGLYGDSLIIGLPTNADRIAELGIELSALEQVKVSRPELDGDNVAGREIDARISLVRTELEEQLRDAFNLANWFWKSNKLPIDAKRGLSNIASYIAEQIYPHAPYVTSELINRDHISSNAKSALRDLLHRMINHENTENLGYEGYPADAGLYYTLVQSSGLHRKVNDVWRFQGPTDDYRSQSFQYVWSATTDLLAISDKTTGLDQLYEFWSKPPFGIKNGVMPILALAYYLSNKQHLAMYVEGTFVPDLDTRYIDEWMQEEKRISFRYVEIGDDRQELLQGLAIALSEKLSQPIAPEPLDSARGLVTIVRSMPKWTHKTNTVSSKAAKIRNLLLNARDPHKVLFNDLPAQYPEITGKKLVNFVVQLIDELNLAYPAMLANVASTFFKALDHEGDISSLRARVDSVKGIAGEFLLESFAARLAVYAGTANDIEGLISLATTKNANECNDIDIDAAIIKLCEWAMEFRTVETIAGVRGRPSTRHAIAVVFGTGQGHSVSNTFDVADSDMPAINNLVEQFMASYKGQIKREVFLAALAEAGTRVVQPNDKVMSK